MVQSSSDGPGEGVEWLDLGRPPSSVSTAAPRADRPSRTSLLAGLAIVVAIVAAYGFGRSGTPAPEMIAAPVEPTSTVVPSAVPEPTATPMPTAVPATLVDLLGEGEVLAELDLGADAKALVWCRETVAGTRIPATLALLHVETAGGLGDQLVSYEELTRPWVPSTGPWRGQADTEGFAASSSAGIAPEVGNAASDGSRCASCAPDRVSFATSGPFLYGNCVHGVPFGAGIAYVIASPTLPGQSPLAVHLSCGITTISLRGDRLLVEAEVPLVRGLTDARFELPSVTLSHYDGRFWADDLGLLAWACDVEQSTQLGDRYTIRTDRDRTIAYERVESAIGPIGVHGPLLVGLERDQCSHLTQAFWGATSAEREDGTPVADLVGLDPPHGADDWVYTCQPE